MAGFFRRKNPYTGIAAYVRIASAYAVQPLMLAACFIGMNAYASDPLELALAQLEANALSFIREPAYQPMDPALLTNEQYYANTFASPSAGPASIHLPDADLDPLSRSILLLEAQEPSLLHVRYQINFSVEASSEVPEVQQAYVQVSRYNLGPAIHAELLESVPAGQVAPPAYFGVGPHLSWRFVLAPAQGMQAALMHASRREISAGQAQAADCLGQRCVSLSAHHEPDLDWRPVTPPQTDQATYRSKTALGSTGAARVLQELWTSLSADGMDTLPFDKDRPQFEFVISQDVSGQDAASIGMVRQAVVMDHAVSEIWTQRQEVASGPAQFSRAYVPRP